MYVLVFHVDGDHPVGLDGKVETILQLVDHEDLLRAKHTGAGGGHQSHGASAKDGQR